MRGDLRRPLAVDGLRQPEESEVEGEVGDVDETAAAHEARGEEETDQRPIAIDAAEVTELGDGATGRIVDENDEKVIVQPNLISPERVSIRKADVADRHPSKISPMPEGLVNLLTADEILDLLAYIESTGKERAANFKTVAAE